MTASRGSPQEYFPKFKAGLPLVDQVVFSGSGMEMFHATYLAARKQQMQGCVTDLMFYLNADPALLAVPRIPIHLYHGLADTIVPPRSSELLAELWPWAKLSLIPGEGHFSLPVLHLKKILD